MIAPLAALFPFDPARTHLNHASFGVPTLAALDRAERERRRIDADAARGLGPELLPRLREAADAAGGLLGAAPGTLALVANSTEGSAAVTASLPLRARDVVVLLDGEYPSVVRGWQVRAAAVGAQVRLAHLALPATADGVLDALDAAAPHGPVRVVVASAVTSSTALELPLAAIGGWAADRGAWFVVDAAHVAGHVALDVTALGAAAVFGTLHKWLPVPRGVGFVWAAPALRDVVRPAVVTHAWDATDVVERFGWRGTWDPASALGLPAAIEEHAGWGRDGHRGRAATMADLASARLAAAGLVPTAPAGLLPPQLRAFIVPGVTREDLDAARGEAGLDAWTGLGTAGETVLRIATHVYTDESDLDRLLAVLARARR